MEGAGTYGRGRAALATRDAPLLAALAARRAWRLPGLHPNKYVKHRGNPEGEWRWRCRAALAMRGAPPPPALAWGWGGSCWAATLRPSPKTHPPGAPYDIRGAHGAGELLPPRAVHRSQLRLRGGRWLPGAPPRRPAAPRQPGPYAAQKHLRRAAPPSASEGPLSACGTPL